MKHFGSWEPGTLGELPAFPWPSIAPTFADATIATWFGYAQAGTWPAFDNTASKVVPQFIAATRAGFFPFSEAGFREFLAWRAVDWASLVSRGYSDWFAWRVRHIEAPGIASAQVMAGYTTALNDLVTRSLLSSSAAQAALDALAAIYSAPSITLTATPTPTTPTASVTPVRMAELVLSKAKSPGDGLHFAVVAWRLQDIDPATRVTLRSMGWNRWDGLVNKLSSNTTKSSFLEDIGDEVARALGMNDPRAAAYWDWANLQRTVALSGPGNPPPTTVNIDTLAAPTSTSLAPVTLPVGTQQTTKPVVNAPTPSPTQPPTTGVTTPVPTQPPPPSVLPPPVGVPPVETETGQLVSPPSFDVDDSSQPIRAQPARPDAGSIASGSAVALLGGLAVLFLLGRRKRR